MTTQSESNLDKQISEVICLQCLSEGIDDGPDAQIYCADKQVQACGGTVFCV